MDTYEFIITGILLLLSLLAIWVYTRYRSDMRSARQRIHELNSQIIETACGPIEYVTRGQGDPVMIIHGVFGGVDQGLINALGFLSEQQHAIVPSRFGYLRTPMPAGATPASQADAHASLLDALGIHKAAVIGVSAGGTSALQFAIRHPERVSALILVSTNVPVDTPVPPRSIMEMITRSDFVFWFATTFFRSMMANMLGVPKGFKVTPANQEVIDEIMDDLHPVSARSAGALFDMFVSNPDILHGYPLEKITAPTLFIHAQDDPMPPYAAARKMSQQVPNARLVTIENGGHLLLGHGDQVRCEILEFLSKISDNHLPAPTGQNR